MSTEHLKVDTNAPFDETPQDPVAKVAETTTEKPPAAEAKVVVQSQPQPKHIAVRDDGVASLVSLSDQLGFAQQLLTQQMVSSTFKTPQQVVVGIQYAKAMKLEPIVGLKMMYVVNGRPCLYGEGPLALCQRSGLVEKIEEFFIDQEQTHICLENKNLDKPVWGAVTRVWRKGDPIMQEDFFTLEDLKKAGLDFDKYGKKKDVWEKWERIMMRYKARAFALRTKFADMIAGIPIAEHDFNFSPEAPEIDVTQPVGGSVADALNKEYLKDEAKEVSQPRTASGG